MVILERSIPSPHFGITKPLSLAGPTSPDSHRTHHLEKFLVDAGGLYESEDESAKREDVLCRIRNLAKDWVKQLTRSRGYTNQMVDDANALIFTFGSYRLGVHGPGADIDTLCVGPSYVNREVDFFYIFHNMLAEMEQVTELHPVPDAHVPVMKFKFDGISVDLLYASISRLVIERDTYGKLQCHPYPNEYVDTSKPCAHSSFFMGLQRKQGEIVEEGQQFDIRGTVDEFKHSVISYELWNLGMDISVSHVRRKQIPSYVFPIGYSRRPLRPATQQQPSNKSSIEENGVGHKRWRVVDGKEDIPEKRRSISPQNPCLDSPDFVQWRLSGSSAECSTSRNAESQSDSSSSGLVSVTSEVGSSEDILKKPMTDGVEGRVQGSSNPGSQTDYRDADSESTVENECVEDINETFNENLRPSIELEATPGIVLRARSEVDSDAMQRSVRLDIIAGIKVSNFGSCSLKSRQASTRALSAPELCGWKNQ
ncbi:hypothetical protein ACFE04_008610 [Oxalis oulophora]